MKNRYVFLRSVLAVGLCMMLPSTALAADWNAGTSDEVYAAYTNDLDATVNIFLTDNIDMTSDLNGNTGQTYTITGRGYTISNLNFGGAGTTIVYADVAADSDDYAVDVYDEADVTVYDDIDGSVYACDNSTLTVNGNITGIDAANDVDMDDPTDFSDPENDSAVYGYDDAVIVINGDVTGANGYGAYSWAQNGVTAYDESNITINGNVVGGSVIGKENVGQENHESVAGDGIRLESSRAKITVNGNVTGGDTNTKLGQGGAGVVLTKNVQSEPQLTTAKKIKLGAVTVDGTVTGGTATGEDGVSGYAVAFDGNDDMGYVSLQPSYSLRYFLAQLTVLKLEPSEEGAPLFGSHWFSDYDFTPEEIQAMADKTIYLVAPAANNGTVASNIDTALAGDTVTLTPTAKEGYALKSLLVNGVELFSENGVFSFVMPEGGALISAQFEPIAKASLATGTAIPKTGDDFPVTLMVLAGIGALCIAAGAFALYRSRKQYRPLHS